ncbi:MAG: hypothetical protein R3Y24_09770 [Eubacteriales bacterium]
MLEMKLKQSQEMKITLYEILFFAFWSIMLFVKGMGWYDGETVFKIALVVGSLCIFTKIAIEKYTIYELIGIVALLGLGGLNYVNSGEKGMLIFIIMMIGMKGISVARTFRVGCVVWGISFFMLIILSQLGMMESTTLIHYKFGQYIVRYSFGYTHPNVLHMSYLTMAMFIAYVVNQKYIVKTVALLMIGNLIAFMYSLSYTGFAVCTIYLFLCLYFEKRKDMNLLEKIVILSIVPLCALFSLLGPVILSSEGTLFRLFDKILNTRFTLSRYFLTTFPVTLFGQRIVAEDASRTMDCSYTFAFVTYGLVMFLGIVVVYIALLKSFIEQKKVKELSITIALLIAGVSEPLLFNTSFKNISFVFVGAYLFTKCKEQSDKKGGFLAKEIQILKFVPVKEFVWRKPKVTSLQLDKRISYKQKIVFLLLALMITIVGKQLFVMPTSYLAPVVQCDHYDGDKIYIAEEELEDYSESKIFNYTDEMTPMYEFDGEVNQVEEYRWYVIVFIGSYYLLCMLNYSYISRPHKSPDLKNEGR